MIYTVLRPHLGDRAYATGDRREAVPRDVAHLVRAGVLAPVVAPPANKAFPPAPKTKSRRQD